MENIYLQCNYNVFIEMFKINMLEISFIDTDIKRTCFNFNFLNIRFMRSVSVIVHVLMGVFSIAVL